MKTVGDKLEPFSVLGVKPGFNRHEENGQSARIAAVIAATANGEPIRCARRTRVASCSRSRSSGMR